MAHRQAALTPAPAMQETYFAQPDTGNADGDGADTFFAFASDGDGASSDGERFAARLNAKHGIASFIEGSFADRSHLDAPSA
jgi:hypothetical protein